MEKRNELNERYRALRKEMVARLVSLAREDYAWQRFERGIFDKDTAASEVDERLEGWLSGVRDDLDIQLDRDADFGEL